MTTEMITTSYGTEAPRLLKVTLSKIGGPREITEVLHHGQAHECDKWQGLSTSLDCEISVQTDVGGWYFTYGDSYLELHPQKLNFLGNVEQRLIGWLKIGDSETSVIVTEMKKPVCGVLCQQ